MLTIGNLTRPDIFDISAKKLDQLYSKVVEIGERITLVNYTEGGGAEKQITLADAGKYDEDTLVRSITGDIVQILEKPDLTKVESQLKKLKEEGFSSLAICFFHAYLYPKHEQEITSLARQMGFQVSVSTELQQMVGIVSRCSSTVADAYLLPKILEGFGSGFEGGLEAMGNKLLFMQRWIVSME